MYFLNLLYHFFIRDLKIYISYKFNLVIQVAFVIIFLVFFNFIFSSLSNDYLSNQSDSMARVIIGIALIDFMISCMSAFNREVRSAQQYGTFEILFQARVPIYLIIISSYSFTFFKTTLRVLLYIFLCGIIFNIDLNYLNIPLFILLMIYFSIPFIGIGLISASFIIYFKQGNFINLIVSIISIFLSGIFFPVDILPTQFQILSEYNPLSNSIDIICNSIILGENEFLLFEDKKSFISTLFQIFIFVPSGLILVYYSFKASKINGSLNHY